MKFSNNIEEVAWFLIVWFLIVEWLFTLVVTTDLASLFFKNDSENNEPKYQASGKKLPQNKMSGKSKQTSLPIMALNFVIHDKIDNEEIADKIMDILTEESVVDTILEASCFAN